VILGAGGFAAAAAILLLTPRFPEPVSTAAKDELAGQVKRAGRFAFPTLLSIGVIDSATRMGFLTFLPFILTAKGASLPVIGVALTLVFAGGAAGKLVCAFAGARIGVIATVVLTEALTLTLILALLPLPLEAAMAILPVLGVALNGTSSVLYGSVPDLVPPERRTRAFGVFYTGTIGAGAIAPFFYGLAGDAFGLTAAVILVAGIVILTLPLAWLLKPAFDQRQSPSTA
jgi:predicted MFS family arabinose efflux permease